MSGNGLNVYLFKDGPWTADWGGYTMNGYKAARELLKWFMLFSDVGTLPKENNSFVRYLPARNNACVNQYNIMIAQAKYW